VETWLTTDDSALRLHPCLRGSTAGTRLCGCGTRTTHSSSDVDRMGTPSAFEARFAATTGAGTATPLQRTHAPVCACEGCKRGLLARRLRGRVTAEPQGRLAP